MLKQMILKADGKALKLDIYIDKNKLWCDISLILKEDEMKIGGEMYRMVSDKLREFLLYGEKMSVQQDFKGKLVRSIILLESGNRIFLTRLDSKIILYIVGISNDVIDEIILSNEVSDEWRGKLHEFIV